MTAAELGIRDIAPQQQWFLGASMKLTLIFQSAAIIALLSLFTGACEGILRGVDDDNSSKQPDPRKDAATVLQETGDPKVDYDDLAKNFLLKGTKKKEKKKEPTKIADIHCTLYKMLEDRRAVTEKIGELVKKNKEARKQLKVLNKQLSKIVEEQDKYGDIPRRSEQNSQWIKPLKSTDGVEKKIKQLKDLYHSNEMKIAVLKTKKFELTESIEMFHLNRIRAAQESNKKQSSEKSFLELGERCKQLSTS